MMLKGKKGLIFLTVMVVASLAFGTLCLAATTEADIVAAVTPAFESAGDTLLGSTLGLIGIIAPVGISIMGVIMVVQKGMNMFKSMMSK